MYSNSLWNQLVMAEIAPDSSKSLEIYEALISSVLQVLREQRRGGAKYFYITGDLKVEFGMMCTDENDTEELDEMPWSFMLARIRPRPGGFKKLIWYGDQQGIQLQCLFQMVCVRKSKRTCLHA